MGKSEWYVDWFNSSYYHLLYNNRNDEEANYFIDNLCSRLHLQPGAKIWDLACGKGRHAVALNKKGYMVTGTDLAGNSIREASAYSNPTLEFLVHDMREPFRKNYFDAVFNLFTSIGYFTDVSDNYSVFIDVAASLRSGGVFVIDFFNSHKVVATINPKYTEKRPGITFDIQKQVREGSVIKRIEFSDQGQHYFFEEKVSLLEQKDFENFAKGTGLYLANVYGNYHFEPFDEATSDRLILIFKK
jgi:cyclopropane fatty-acyl-phospholipid synthase-like methyltransferase